MLLGNVKSFLSAQWLPKSLYSLAVLVFGDDWHHLRVEVEALIVFYTFFWDSDDSGQSIVLFQNVVCYNNSANVHHDSNAN